MWRTLMMSFGVMSLMLAAGCAPDRAVASGEVIVVPPETPVEVGRPVGRASLEVTVFARDLILNQTANDTLPTATEDKDLIDVNSISFEPDFFK